MSFRITFDLHVYYHLVLHVSKTSTPPDLKWRYGETKMDILDPSKITEFKLQGRHFTSHINMISLKKQRSLPLVETKFNFYSLSSSWLFCNFIDKASKQHSYFNLFLVSRVIHRTAVTIYTIDNNVVVVNNTTTRDRIERMDIETELSFSYDHNYDMSEN